MHRQRTSWLHVTHGLSAEASTSVSSVPSSLLDGEGPCAPISFRDIELKCLACDGRGYFDDSWFPYPFGREGTTPCYHCRGAGKVPATSH